MTDLDLYTSYLDPARTQLLIDEIRTYIQFGPCCLHHFFNRDRLEVMSEQIAQRIIGDLGVDDLVDLLSEKLSGAELHSILLTVLKRRVGKIESSHLTRPNAVTQSCELDGRLLNEVERVGYSVAPHFEAIELAPLAPLGAIATLTGLDQGKVLSAIRAYECASDPMREEREGIRLSFNLRRLTGLGYYEGPCFHIKAKNDRGEQFALADGGFVNWTQRLLGDSKERLLTSAIGAELMCRMFGRSRP